MYKLDDDNIMHDANELQLARLKTQLPQGHRVLRTFATLATEKRICVVAMLHAMSLGGMVRWGRGHDTPIQGAWVRGRCGCSSLLRGSAEGYSEPVATQISLYSVRGRVQSRTWPSQNMRVKSAGKQAGGVIPQRCHHAGRPCDGKYGQ